ncbi:MAG: 1-acyl-sn-glycerol-3-phosphate acyltransferase [Bacteroidales bacterium]|nr:1-acyl-sn-glycerol-3-phosphate acyltransferase [Bacteroidales bacterium]
MEERKATLINIENIIKTKNPALYKKLPRFAIRWLEKIICQDQNNRLLSLYGHHDGVGFIDAVFEDMKIETNCYGLENVDYQGKKVFVANHPLGALDGLAVISMVNKHFGKSKGIVNELLLNLDPLRSVFCGVNVYGHNTQDIVRNIDALYESDENICIFPAGLVSRRIDGVIQDLPWKKNFIEKAYANKIPIVPVYVDAQNTRFFYSVANWRKRIGIKFNYELILLPSEVFKYSGKPIGLHFGRPIMPDELAACNNAAERTLKVRELTYSLKQQG